MARNHRSELLELLEDLQPPDKGKKRRPNPKNFMKVIAAIGDDPHLLKLFDAIGENYRDPFAWYGLMGIFADFLFEIPKINPGGRPKKWIRPAKRVVQRDIMNAARAINAAREHKTLRGLDIVKHLQDELPKRYGGVAASTVLRELPVLGISFKDVRRHIKANPSKKGNLRHNVSLK